MWPQFVKDRIQSTYGFFGGSCLLTAAAAAGVFRSPRLLSLASRGGLMVSFLDCTILHTHQQHTHVSLVVVSRFAGRRHRQRCCDAFD